jgi:hypothetical protein
MSSNLKRSAHRPATVLPFLLGIVGFAVISFEANASLVNISSSTSQWTAIRYGGNNGYDPTIDQQTGSAEGDIVGNAQHGSVYTYFGDRNTLSLTDGDLAFRMRLGADSTPLGFKTAMFVGIMTNPASGRIDLFVGVNNAGQNDQVGIWNPGTGLNTSPNTTTIVSPALVSYGITSSNYSWMGVTAANDPSATNFDIDGGGAQDHFLSFSIPFSDIVAQLAARGITGIDQNSTFAYVIATSTQGNSLNQDLNGVGANYNGNSTWGQLGAVSDPHQPVGAVPELNPAMGAALLLLGVIAHRHVQQRRLRTAAVRVPLARR